MTDLALSIRVAAIIRDLSPKQFEAWLKMGQRIVAGMPVTEAEALMWDELAVGGKSLMASKRNSPTPPEPLHIHPETIPKTSRNRLV